MRKHLFLWLGVFMYSSGLLAQASPYYKGGLKVDFDEDGKKYLRIISWAQFHAVYSDAEAASNPSFKVRRARVLMFSQINEKFLILSHFGLNSLSSTTMSPTGKEEGSQLFFHDVWAQYKILPDHVIGGGLHYFNGISRLNNQSTLNMLTLDNNRQSWSTLGLADQFARHVGVFAKGKFGKLQYRIAINDAIVNSLDTRDAMNGEAVYAGTRLLGSKEAGKVYAGYMDFHFLDQESNFLPFKVGSYLGGKKVFNVGAGFFLHPQGAAILDGAEIKGEDVKILAADIFYDTPLSDNGSALTAYGVFQSNFYGTNYLYSAYGTGNMMYGHFGYVLPGTLEKIRFQPYLAYAVNTYDAVDDNRTVFSLGTNTYLSGNNSKLTLEYQHQKFGDTKLGTVTLQAMIYL
ncbi:hypothetical protein SAMN05216480_11478 [Pustulibacterium marinum]|uniref:Short chain amide porin n=1 Tax=Pustulibacterium marinum TaxID=1224947 RepID=A0A1I7IBR5_9FLAO|nr:hypothetical protein [Pustulibacterium marinum]SFU70402.1 hypothetical protein SAMN05216480_11478 [Pustulibacterium marinum]